MFSWLLLEKVYNISPQIAEK